MKWKPLSKQILIRKEKFEDTEFSEVKTGIVVEVGEDCKRKDLIGKKVILNNYGVFELTVSEKDSIQEYYVINIESVALIKESGK